MGAAGKVPGVSTEEDTKMTGRSTGRIALVTGASRGIGRAIALRLARDGVSVVVNYAGNAEAAHGVVADVERSGGKAIAVQADVSKFADVTRLFDVTIEQFGRLDILVNNAGIFFTKPLDEVTEQDFDRIVGVNIKGTYFACQQAARGMADGGRIVNFSSSTTAMVLPRYSAYVATKGAVEQLTRSLARELGRAGSRSTSSRRARWTPSCSPPTRPRRTGGGSRR